MKKCLVVREEGGFGVRFGRNVQAGVIPPYLVVPMVTWAMEKSWEGESRKVFDFINGLCHHVTFLLPPFSASLLHVSLLALGEGAKHLNEQPNRLSTTLGTPQKGGCQCFWNSRHGLFIQKVFPFQSYAGLWQWTAFGQISQPNDTRFSRAAQTLFNVQSDPGASSDFLPSRSSFLFTCLFLKKNLNSLPLCNACFLHLCLSFCDHLRKWFLFYSAQLSVAIFCEKHTLALNNSLWNT